MNQSAIAKACNVSPSILSENLSGKKPVAVKTSKKYSRFTGRSWKDFLDMPPADLRAALEAAYTSRQSASESEAQPQSAVGL